MAVVRTRNLDELVDVVSKVYCPFTIKIVGRARDIEAVFDVSEATSQPLVTLSHSAPVRIDAGNFENLFLVMHCAHGRFSARQQSERGEFFSGQSVPLSAGINTTLDFDWGFLQKSVRLDPIKLEQLCGRWLGHPVGRGLRFALRPFSANLQAAWQRTLFYLEGAGDLLLSGPAKAAFDEYLLTLLLHHHPHTYSDELTSPARTPASGLVRRAERYMADRAAEPITVSDVAADLGVSMRSLEAGFRQWRETTPSAFLRNTRLWLAHAELSRADGRQNVTAVAMSSGFPHLGRFSAYYRAAFGENPSDTLRRRLRRI
jgi:AraC-like DNA-binding protein